MDTKNRLQFRHHDQVFDTREAAIEYIQSQIRFTEQGLAAEDPRYGYSLLAEPTVLLYKNETEQDPTGEDNPHLIIALGSRTNDGTQYSDNRFCIIDIDKTEQEIADLQAELEAAIRSLTLIALSSDTLNFFAEKTEEGTYVSGDVKVAESHIFDDVQKKNNLMVTPEGLFIYVNLEYDPENEQFTFTVSNADGTLTQTTVNFSDNYLISGYYDKTDESIHLQMRDGEEIVVDCEDLIAEWGVEGEASRTPVVLTREEVDYDHTDEHHHVEPWQDVLRADVRIKDEEKILLPNGTYKYEKDPRSTNILDRTSDGRYLYVDGKASNIIYYMNGEKSTVKAALDELQKIKLSSDSDNILINKVDGFFASSKLEYISSANKLIFKTSGHPDKEIQLNSVELFERVYYDPTREVLVLTYKDSTGQTQFVEVPIGEMIRDWEWEPLNEGHNVKIVKKRNVSGNDKVSADVKIYDDPDNILVDKNHELFVKGTADNIKYEDGTVKDALDAIKDKNEEQDDKLDELDGKIGSGFTNDPHDNVTYKFEQLSEKLDNEIERSTTKDDELETALNEEITRSTEKDTEHDEAIERIDTTIGSGFSTDAHETVTYKFEQLQNQVNEEADKLQQEIDRSTAKDEEHDGRLDAIDAEIGDGFGPRNTVRDEIDNLQGEIDALSAETASKLQDINSDNSINIDKTEPTIPVISVNLSEEVEHGKENIIKLNNDGLYAGVDLSYIEEGNKLIFSTTNGEKEIQLESMSSIISITYDPSKEAIIITYMTNGHEVKTVEIPVGDLINEWRVEDGHPHAVQLEKVRVASGTSEQDVLKASVIINDNHDDNILIMDDGALYVSGAQISANTAAIEALEDRMDTAEDDIDALQDGLAAEIARATSAETALDAKIDQEIADRIADVDAEETRAKAAESALSESIQNEITRATSEEQRIESKLDDEISRSTTKDQELTDAINAETVRAISAETALQTAIDNETTRATNAETNLRNDLTTTQANLADEISRATSEEQRIEAKLDNEITRSTTKDQELTDAINAETVRATSAETALQTAIGNETTRAIMAEENLAHAIEDEAERRLSADTILDEKISAETARATSAETALNTAITNEVTRATTREDQLAAKDDEIILALQQEIADRQQGDADLAQAIRDAELTFDDTTSIDFTKTSGNVVTADVKLQEGDNIIKLGQGLYASVHLSYDPGTNKIKLVTSNGADEEIQLVGASLLENLVYDPVEKELVITYKDAAGEEHIVSFGVEELFNDWIIQNPSEKSALELTKTPPSAHTAGSPDVLYGRVLITDDHDGDGKPDQGSDNVIEIRNNGLYVDGSAMAEALEIAECAKNELKSVEKAVIGHIIAEECGSGYTYEPNIMSYYINSATSFYNADYILDLEIHKTNVNVDIVSAKTDCVDSKANVLYKLLYGENQTMPECGEGVEYHPYSTACVISGATSFMEADQLLNDQICQILTMWASGITCTNESSWIEDGMSRKLQVDTRLSYGKYATMTDEDLYTDNIDGAYIDPTNTEFTDTNALRIVCLDEDPSGVTPSVETKQNGIYLSNVWDCGLYYDAGTPADQEAQGKAQAAGYNTNYSTDDSPSARNYNYMNNVRQNDIPHN